MMIRTIATLCALLAFVSTGIGGVSPGMPRQAYAQGQPILKSGHSPPCLNGSPVLDGDPLSMRTALTQCYRLPPDKRFLMAVAQVHSFFTGEETSSVTAGFSDGIWQITYRGKLVGTVPELPGFRDLMNLVEGWVRSLQAEKPLQWGSSPVDSDCGNIQNQLNVLRYSNDIAALRKIDALWKEGGPKPCLLTVAARTLVYLVLQALDHLETGDRLHAKAVAVLALANTLQDCTSVREECLLSYAMDYSCHAAELAKTLPEDDPVRLYVMHDDRRLEEIARRDAAAREARFLRLLRAVESDEPDRNLIGEFFPRVPYSLPAMKIVADRGMRFAGTPLSEMLPNIVLSEVLYDARILKAMESGSGAPENEDHALGEAASPRNPAEIVPPQDASHMLTQYETGLQEISKRIGGPFLDSTTYQDFYDGYFFTPYYDDGLRNLDRISSLNAVRDFCASLWDKDDGIPGDFKRWYSHLSAFKEGKVTPQSVRTISTDDFASLRMLGLPPLMRTLLEVRKAMEPFDMDRLKIARALISRLDSRVMHRRHLLDISGSLLLDVKLREKLAASILRDNPHRKCQFCAWYAAYSGDERLLHALLNADDTDCPTRLKILGYLETGKQTTTEELIGHYRKILADYPDNWDVTREFQGYLMRIQKYQEVRDVMNQWLDRETRWKGLDRIDAKSAIATTYLKEGRYEEGWKVIEPEISSWKANAMATGARLLDKMNRGDEAEKIVLAAVGRYPDEAWCRGLLANLYWRHGKHREAALFLDESSNRLSTRGWQYQIAPRFAEAFSDQPKEQTLAAFSALIEQRHDSHRLSMLAGELAAIGLHELAFELCSQLHGPDEPQEMDLLLRSYTYLKEFKGKAAALDWLRSRITPALYGQSVRVAYYEKHFDIIWDLPPDPDRREDSDFIWLIRAAASLKLGPENDPHRRDLISHFEKNGGHSPENVKGDAATAGVDTRSLRWMVGRYLCGFASEEDLLRIASTPVRRCGIAYYLGVRNQAEGRYSDASDWYRVAIEAGAAITEYEWAVDTLQQWVFADMSLNRLTIEKR